MFALGELSYSNFYVPVTFVITLDQINNWEWIAIVIQWKAIIVGKQRYALIRDSDDEQQRKLAKLQSFMLDRKN